MMMLNATFLVSGAMILTGSLTLRSNFVLRIFSIG
jgi:hypothetical protein